MHHSFIQSLIAGHLYPDRLQKMATNLHPSLWRSCDSSRATEKNSAKKLSQNQRETSAKSHPWKHMSCHHSSEPRKQRLSLEGIAAEIIQFWLISNSQIKIQNFKRKSIQIGKEEVKLSLVTDEMTLHIYAISSNL